jgi:uncharacterized protein with PQ loop repeat
MLLRNLAFIFISAALLLDTLSYYRQIKKTLKAKKSSQISSTAFLYKIGKVICAIAGLAIYSNWVGLSMEVFMLVVYLVSLWVIIRFKPKRWSLWK